MAAAKSLEETRTKSTLDEAKTWIERPGIQGLPDAAQGYRAHPSFDPYLGW